jgi:hypothetical protein
MCIFSGTIENVSNTKILVSVVYPSSLVTKNVSGKKRGVKVPDTQHPLQLTIYSNQVALGAKTSLETTLDVDSMPVYEPAMVLPFPLRNGKNRVKLIDLSNYSGIFEDLDLLFPTFNDGSRSRGIEQDYMTNESASPLEVHYVGSYKASIVPNWDSFNRLQYAQFNLSPDTQELLGKYYRRGYGFMVCQLVGSQGGEAGHKYHPFAYYHEVREDGRLFVPTRHYHKKPAMNPYAKYHTISDASLMGDESDMQDLDDHFMNTLTLEDKWLQLNIKRTHIINPEIKKPLRPGAVEGLDWDHEIYVVNCERVRRNPLLINKLGARVISADSSKLQYVYTYLDSAKLPMDIAFGKIYLLDKIKINSSYKYNHDFMI